ncbi:MAG TPA: tRNA (adenosine(37)-N6)-threonylcarbamoyltransferase complex dimerization subunit type 1 TsaB [Peptococcaceae bacterium]|nr:tRNA (adenosine(37)-N6)-threonylcarbamoyltransferase complex dimerization subunit type 1 TsaB [Peptococcaceae bacterium]
MKYLTIDTTTKITALSLAENGKLVSEGFLHTGKTHSERLIPMLDQLLNAADWKLEELDFIGVVRGPGSFTGIRIGMATALGLAQVLNIPLVGITSLDTLAWAGKNRPEETVVILDARKNEYYYARYRWQEKKILIAGPQAITPANLLQELRVAKQRYFFVGDAVPGAQEFLMRELGDQAIIPAEYEYLPRGAYATCETWEKWLEGEVSPSTHLLEPFYIRLSEAEVNYRKKNLAKLEQRI